MLDFVFIFVIFSEIILTAICIKKITVAEKKCKELNEKVVEAGKLALEINKKLKETVGKVNKVIAIITNKKLITFSRIVKTTVDIIQIIILFRSLDFSKGIKSINFKNIRKIFLLETSRQILKNLFLRCSN